MPVPGRVRAVTDGHAVTTRMTKQAEPVSLELANELELEGLLVKPPDSASEAPAAAGGSLAV